MSILVSGRVSLNSSEFFKIAWLYFVPAADRVWVTLDLTPPPAGGSQASGQSGKAGQSGEHQGFSNPRRCMRKKYSVIKSSQ